MFQLIHVRHSFTSDVHQHLTSEYVWNQNVCPDIIRCSYAHYKRLLMIFTVQWQVTWPSLKLIFIVISHHQGLCILLLAVAHLPENTFQASFKCPHCFCAPLGCRRLMWDYWKGHKGLFHAHVAKIRWVSPSVLRSKPDECEYISTHSCLLHRRNTFYGR